MWGEPWIAPPASTLGARGAGHGWDHPSTLVASLPTLRDPWSLRGGDLRIEQKNFVFFFNPQISIKKRSQGP